MAPEVNIDTLDKRKSYMMYFSIGTGAIIGYALTSNPGLESFKLLNIIGILFDFFGVVILSPLIIKNDKLNRFISVHVVDFIFLFTTSCPAGMMMSSFALITRNHHSEIDIDKSVITVSAVLLSVGYPLFLIYSVLEGVTLERWNTPIKRSKILGGFLVLSGIVIQLIGAIIDLLGQKQI